MNRIKGFLMIIFVIILCIASTGCNAIGIDVESQLRPPKNNGDQEELQNALDRYVSEESEKGEISAYSLKYPMEGDYLSAFILLDQVRSPAYVSQTDTVPVKEENDVLANYCIAFYRMDTDNSKVHINLLKNADGAWASVSDVEGYGEEIAQVDFADLDGDGFPELLIGWNMYNTKDKRLAVYSLKTGLDVLSFGETYTAMAVSDLTADNADDLLLLSIAATGKRVVARLLSYDDTNLVTVGWTDLDSDIQQFTNAVTAVFSETQRGIFIDAYKDPDTTITELVLWENDTLQSPFCSKETLITTVTAREVPLTCRDIDGDGIVEWPLFSRLPGYDEESLPDEIMWKTSWFFYDPVSGTIENDFESVINLQDGYNIKLTDKWSQNFTADYDSENRLLQLCDLSNEDGTVFLKIQTSTSGKKSDLLDGLVYFDKSDSLHYAVWYDEALDISVEEIQYLFSVL